VAGSEEGHERDAHLLSRYSCLCGHFLLSAGSVEDLQWRRKLPRNRRLNAGERGGSSERVDVQGEGKRLGAQSRVCREVAAEEPELDLAEEARATGAWRRISGTAFLLCLPWPPRAGRGGRQRGNWENGRRWRAGVRVMQGRVQRGRGPGEIARVDCETWCRLLAHADPSWHAGVRGAGAVRGGGEDGGEEREWQVARPSMMRSGGVRMGASRQGRAFHDEVCGRAVIFARLTGLTRAVAGARFTIICSPLKASSGDCAVARREESQGLSVGEESRAEPWSLWTPSLRSYRVVVEVGHDRSEDTCLHQVVAQRDLRQHT
jgi:hypothetical protein